MTLKIVSIILTLTIVFINLTLVAFLLAGSHGNLDLNNIETLITGLMIIILLVSALALDLHAFFRFTGKIEGLLLAFLKVLMPLSFLVTIYLIYKTVSVDQSNPDISFQPMVYIVYALTVVLITFVLRFLFMRPRGEQGAASLTGR